MRQRREGGHRAEEGIVGGCHCGKPRRELRAAVMERLQCRSVPGTGGPQGLRLDAAAYGLRKTRNERPQPHRQPG
jgi:hypothetical protein